MAELIALVLKDVRLLMRDKAAFFFTVGWPLIMALFGGYIYTFMMKEGPRNIPIAVVDEDGTDESEAFVARLKEAPEFEVLQTDRERAADLVRRGRRAAYVVLASGFGESRERMFWGPAPELEIGIDPSRKAEAGMIEGVLTRYVVEGMQDTFSDPDAMRRQIGQSLADVREADAGDMDPMLRAALEMFLPALDQFLEEMPKAAAEEEEDFRGFEPVRIKKADQSRKGGRRLTGFEIAFPQGMMWGVLGCTATFGISLVSERTRGTLVRLRMAPFGRMRILLGKGLACAVVNIVVCVFLMILAVTFFGITPRSYGLLGLGILILAFGFGGIVMLLAVLGRTEQSAGGFAWAAMLVMAMLGGGMIPLATMPPTLQAISNVSPIKWGIYAIEGGIWRNVSFVELLPAYGILLGAGAVCAVIGGRTFRWTD